MYIKDGICYAGELVPEIEVSAIKILDDGMLLVDFSTGETRLFDVTSLLDKGSAFSPLANEENRKTAKVTHGFFLKKLLTRQFLNDNIVKHCQKRAVTEP